MSIPRYLLAVAILFWGWQTGWLFLAGVIAVLLEANYWTSWRLELNDQDYYRIVDICSLLIVALGIYFYMDDNREQPLIIVLLTWLPICVLPILLAQQYGKLDEIPFTALFMSLRKQSMVSLEKKTPSIDFQYPFFILCLLASSVNKEFPYYFMVVTGLFAWALWCHRPRHYHGAIWLGLLAMSIGIAILLQQGLRSAQNQLEEWVMQWLGNRWHEVDPFYRRTAIGQIGRLKGSDKILVWLESKQPPPKLLRNAVYNHYQAGTWTAVFAPFEILSSDDDNHWQLHSSKLQQQSVTIMTYFQQPEGVLPVPIASSKLRHLVVGQLKQNTLGSLQVTDVPKFVHYQVDYQLDNNLDSPPNELDLKIVEIYRKMLQQVLSSLDIENKSPQQRLEVLKNFFRENYHYSLVQSQTDFSQALAQFLLKSKSGHCEYFATTTVLLLRAMGIPARYVTGFAVDEYSDWEQQYLIRQRHAHAWAMAYLQGKWLTVDTTPANWNQLEQQQMSAWQIIWDGMAWLKLKFQLWKAEIDEDEIRLLLMLVLFALVGFLVARKLLGIQWKSESQTKPEDNTDDTTINQSEILAIMDQIQIQGYPRKLGQTWWQWLQQIKQQHPQGFWVKRLQLLVFLYYHQRFHPQGLSAKQQQQLQRLLKYW